MGPCSEEQSQGQAGGWGRPGSRAPRRLCDKGGEQQSWDRVGGGVPGHLQATPSHPCGDRGPLRPPTSAVSFLHDLTMAGSPCTPPPARKLKGHGVRRGVAQAPEGAPKPPAGSKTACTTARQGALRVLPKARPLGDMKLDSEFTELRGSLSAEVSGAPGLCRRAPPPGTRLPPALGSGPPSSCRRAHEELFKAASRCLRRPRGAAHPGRSLRLVLPPAISPCSRQAAISATCLQGRKKGREELLLNTILFRWR